MKDDKKFIIATGKTLELLEEKINLYSKLGYDMSTTPISKLSEKENDIYVDCFAIIMSKPF